jgi:rsbT co-antagonist protein RsbR
LHQINDSSPEALLSERAQLQQRVAELEGRLALHEALVSQFPNGVILLFDHELRYTLADGTTLEPLGLSKGKLEGKTIWEALPPETCDALEPLYRAALDGQSTIQEVPYGDHLFELRTQPLYDPHGRLLSGMVVATDISGRKADELALQAANRRVVAILEEMPDAFFRLGPDWRFTYVNHQAEPLLDHRVDELVGEGIWDMFPEAVGTPFEQHYRTAMQTQQMVLFEQFYPPLNRWFEVRAVPAPDSLSVYFHDISDRKRGELAAQEQAELFQTVIDQMSDGVILADPDGQFRIFNRASQHLFGPAPDSPDTAWSEEYGIFLDDQRTPFPLDDLPVFRAVRGEETRNVELFVRHREAPEGVWITVNGRPLFDREGQITGGLVVCRDDTERRRSAAERAQLQEEIIQIQSVALRELSTPLIPINDQVVVMPLVGSVDSHRAEQVMETMLDGISRNRARVAILDITGVPVVDTQVANALLRIAQSARLLGTHVVLTGIRPEVAQTLVGLGVGLEGIVTRSTLQSGIAYAMGRT